MKTILIIAAYLSAAMALGYILTMEIQARDKAMHHSGNTPGTRPGDIGKANNIDQAAAQRGHELATFAAGCFWGVESEFRNLPGVIATAVGYTGGKTSNPTYEQVCAHGTGHAEAVLVEFDPKKISYEQLLDAFFEIHDPTTLNRQGPDIGSQYRSAIFSHNPKQEASAKAAIQKLEKTGKFKRPIVTEVVPATTFWLAEDYHQQYNEKRGIAGCKVR